MRKSRKWLCWVCATACCGLCAAQSVGKYQLILDRKLFGAEPPPPETPAEPIQETAPEPAWSREYRMTMMTVDHTPAGEERVRIGLEHMEGQSAFLLLENDDTYPDFTLVEADYVDGTASVRHRGVVHEFTIKEGLVQEAPPSPNQTERPRRRIQVRDEEAARESERRANRRRIIRRPTRSRRSP